tara:strand:- start:86 stop:517 length:432 start_codon:yes stop_codon:yes gene_type:complete
VEIEMRLKKIVEAGHEEGRMARGQLERAIDYSTMLRDRIDDEDELPSWVQSKITKSMDYLQSVYNYMDGKDGVVEGRNPKITRKEMEEVRLFTEKNVPNDKKKWAASKAAAKRKFKVYPSAYANAWAAKNYKAKGGTWRKSKG